MHSPENEDPFFIGNFQTGNIIRPPDYCDPTGPSFKKGKLWKIFVEGTEIIFRAPKHRPFESRIKAVYPRKHNRYGTMRFAITHAGDMSKDDGWRSCVLFSHSWSFNGPFLTGPLAYIDSAFVVLRYETQTEGTSYFHPRVFEHAIVQLLTDRFAGRKENGQHTHIAPIDWQPVTTLPVPAVRLKIISNDDLTRYGEDEYLIFTLDDHHIAYIPFHYHRLVHFAVTKADLDKHVGDKNLHELVNKIINSVSITLSPEAKAQQQKALQGVDDPAVTKTFPPLKWDRDVETYNDTQRKLASK